MSKISKFDRAVCAVVARRIEEALAPLAAELGVVVKVKGGNFTASDYNAKVEFAVVGEDGIAQTRDGDSFRVMAPLYGFSADDLGRKFTQGRKTYQITGWRSRSGKRPILARDDENREYAFTIEGVKSALGIK